ncbi:ABC transporter ATP-binding protein [Pseudoduganella ginsengisoli]|uniref:ATP-binding cassette domain-containing protein n=1 Tax=Pseudoduganella ginsengisoli TaxID=1462440 RepID=A0A6L6Q1J9_9BURK|nr:ABC transporter ATP-binding protein [Pseudoduganella ginsengisoli]MTW03510.1 ATP-binding cassette domain-containing protein [Pseudoduganella ginsengisoli]
MAALHVQDLSKRYTRGAEAFTALDKVSFTIQPGELVALTGPSGSGKSTLLNIIAGYDQADDGSVVVNGFDVTRAKPADMDVLRTRTVGFIFQQFHLVPGLNALENVELSLLNAGLSKAERRARAAEALRRMGLAEHSARRPALLSGGQQQRVAVARALAAKPSVVLADEPTAALDRANAESLMDQLAALARENGMAALVSTHDQRCLDRVDRVIRLENGALS